MKKVAVLMDGGYARKALNIWRHHQSPKPTVTADHLLALAEKCVDASQDEELFRIHFYDSWPYAGKQSDPLGGLQRDFSLEPFYSYHWNLFDELRQKPKVAFRAGQLKFRGWRLTDEAVRELKTNPRTLLSADFAPVLQQKGVDIKLGLDIATLAGRRQVDRIILFTADTDFIPAMKHARREGMEVIYAYLSGSVQRDFAEHSDDVRQVVWP
jgi:uncharacterized LabA/DUF88 family protein